MRGSSLRGTVVAVRRKHQRLVSAIGAVVFAGLAVTFVLRGGTLDLVMAVLATAVAAAHGYTAVTGPKQPR